MFGPLRCGLAPASCDFPPPPPFFRESSMLLVVEEVIFET